MTTLPLVEPEYQRLLGNIMTTQPKIFFTGTFFLYSLARQSFQSTYHLRWQMFCYNICLANLFNLQKKWKLICTSTLTHWIICPHNALVSHLKLVPRFRAYLIYRQRPLWTISTMLICLVRLGSGCHAAFSHRSWSSPSPPLQALRRSPYRQ